MENELILHHYTNSPFAAKVRVAMGIKQLKWKSLQVPMINKNRITTELTGGYRRIPVLQVGRDFYCDSTLILRYLDTRNKKQQQDLELALLVGSHFDKSVFPAVVAQLFSSDGGAAILDGTGVTLEEMMQDRAQMMQGSNGVSGSTRKDQLYSYLAQVEDLLDGNDRDFLMPGSTPTFADACAFAQFDRIVQREVFHDFPKLTGWLERIRAIGEGNSEQCTEKYAMEAIHSANSQSHERTPPTTEHNSKLQQLGKMVTLKPEDYGNFEINGKLVAVDKHSIVVERALADTKAKVRLHFPRLGYKLSSQSKL